jgi:hypothetical protein
MLYFVKCKNASPGIEEGRIYVARSEMEEIDLSTEMPLDIFIGGRWERIANTGKILSRPDQVFAVICALRSLASTTLRLGSVVRILSVDIQHADGDFIFEISHHANRLLVRSGELVVLDRSIVRPGVSLMMEDDGVWGKANIVDGDLSVEIGGHEMRPITRYRFPVGTDGDILSDPIVMCTDSTGSVANIVCGQRYLLSRFYPDHDSDEELVMVIGDDGEEGAHFSSRFVLGG